MYIECTVEQKKMRKKVKYEGKDILYETLIERSKNKKESKKEGRVREQYLEQT